jgi:hypothetical protein
VRRHFFVFALLVLLLAPFAFAADSATEAAADKSVAKPETARSTEPTYEVTAGLDGEIFPFFANFASLQKASERTWGTVAVTITNSSINPLRARLTVEVPGWSDQEIQLAQMAAGVKRTFVFAPTFLPRFYANNEIIAATVVVRATDAAGRTLFTTTAPVRLRAAGDIHWGSKFKYAQFIASWVTPHDARIEQILSRAKELMPGRRLPGYEPWKSDELQERSTRAQARAIYKALQDRGVSYVKSSLTFGNDPTITQRIRMPRESLRYISANCIDGVVMYASLFENLDMDPVVVLVPGHAYVGVPVAKGSNRYLYLDTALTGRATFDAAVEAADKGMATYKPHQVIRINIAEARRAGIYPMPDPAAVAGAVVAAAGE